MKRATLTETKNNLSALVDQVRGGESVLILDRGRPVARLVSVVSAPDPEGRLARLERLGLVRRAEAVPPQELLTRRPPAPRGGASITEALLAERRSGR
jgi:prevent-host-death family protein